MPARVRIRVNTPVFRVNQFHLIKTAKIKKSSASDKSDWKKNKTKELTSGDKKQKPKIKKVQQLGLK